MITLDGYYLNPHITQYDGSRLANANCTPASGASGTNAATGGKVVPTGAQIRALVKNAEETSPSTPGWSLVDLVLAMRRLGVPFANRSGDGWVAVRRAHAIGLYLVLQGDSDRFANSTCSGAFNGDHAIGVHPATSGTRWWINDPICKAGRWEEESVLRAYAAKLEPTIRFGAFTVPVPRQAITPKEEKGVVVVTIEKFPARAFTAVGVLQRYSATAELSPIAAGYSATVDGDVTITGNPSAPTGSGFLRLASGGSKGRYVKAEQVTL